MERSALLDATWLADTFARNRALFGDSRMEADGGDGGDGDGDGGGKGDEGKKTDDAFTQADVDRIVAERLKREREATRTKYADYDDLKKKAEGSATAEEQIAQLKKEVEATRLEALKRRVQAAHSIPDEDADLFLTGTDEETLTAQAKRLADRETERKKQGNRVPSEGTTPTAKAGDEREFVRELFGRGG